MIIRTSVFFEFLLLREKCMFNPPPSAYPSQQQKWPSDQTHTSCANTAFRGDSDRVPPEFAGTLERENANIVVSSESAAKARAQRYAAIHARSKELLAAQEANTAKAQGAVGGELSPDLDGSLYREDENLVVVSQSKAEVQKRRLAEARERLEAPHNTTPTENVSASCAPSQKPAAWWRQFIFPGALIPKTEATLALQIILAELRIAADERALDFKTDQIAQSTFCETLEGLTDGDLGWRAMTQIYERELRS